MEDFEALSDEELLLRLKQGESRITDYLMEKYKGLVRKRANALYLLGGDNDDLIQEGMIGLFKAIQEYSEGKNSSFYHFADICISRQMYTAIEASQRKKHSPLNFAISIDGEKEEGVSDLLSTLQEADPEAIFISREGIREIEEKMEKTLSKMEQEVLQYYLQGMNYRQIAEEMGKSPKAIDNALQRIKNKLV